jgi:hypothetical protein
MEQGCSFSDKEEVKEVWSKKSLECLKCLEYMKFGVPKVHGVPRVGVI